MKKLIWFTTSMVLFLVFLLPGFLALGIKYIPFNVQPPLHKTKDIYWKFTVSQEFISQEGNLMGIGMTIKNPNLKNKKDVFLSIYNEKGELMRTSKLNGGSIQDGSFVKFLFEPIAGSGSQKYTFTIAAPSADAGEVLSLFYTEEQLFWIGKMMFDDEEFPGGISFVTYHKPGNKWEVIKGIYSNWFSRLLSPDSQKI